MTCDRVIAVDGLRVRFNTRHGELNAVDDVSFALSAGETLGIVGESGSGKSATALAMMRLIPSPAGEIVGGDIAYRGRSLLTMSEKELRGIRGNRMAMIFQDPVASLNPMLRVGRQVAEPMLAHRKMRKRPARQRAAELLQAVGISDAAARMHEYPHQLSGGMCQRVMIATALANDPDVIIADEPTTALDATIQAQVLDLMLAQQARLGSAVVLITHDLGVIAQMADSVLVMYAGRSAERAPVGDLYSGPLHPYTWGLMDSLPGRRSDGGAGLRAIAGQPPSLTRVPTGCAFHPRCPYAEPVCARERPRLRSVRDGHSAACHFAGEPGFVRGERRRETHAALGREAP